MMTEENKALVRRFYQAFAADDQSACAELLASDLVAYSHSAPGPQNRTTHLQGIRMWNTAFRDTHFTIEEQIAEGDKVATRVTLRAVHSGGEFQGLPPTGKQIAFSGTSIERIKDGRIVERHVDSDFLGLMRQLGLISPQQVVSE